MSAEDYRHRVVVEHRVQPPLRDSYGTQAETWETYSVHFAAIEPLTGREFLEAQAQQARVDHRVRFRYDRVTAGIKTGMRLRRGEILYDITSVVNPNMRNREIHVMARVQT
jgi:SPP1 family predicted phage head-tail adaptor